MVKRGIRWHRKERERENKLGKLIMRSSGATVIGEMVCVIRMLPGSI